MSQVRGLVIALFLSAVALAGLGGAAALAADNQHATQASVASVRDCDPVLTPDHGPAGTVVAGRFVDNIPMFEFNVYFQTTGQPNVLVAHAHADMLGVALFSFTVPSGATEGAHNVLTEGVAGNCDFTTTFTVGPNPTVPPPATPAATPPATPPATVPVPTPTVAAPSAGNGGSGLQLRDVTPAAGALLLFGMTCFILAMSRRPRPMVVFTTAAKDGRRPAAPTEAQSLSMTPATAGDGASPKRGALFAGAAVVAGAVAVWFTRKR
jgi:hypothetical protein